MSTTVNRKKRMTEISEKIKECDAYLAMDVDPTAQNRVKAMEDNPCVSGVYYINAIYKTPQEYQLTPEQTRKLAQSNGNWESFSVDYNNIGTGYIVVKNFWTKNNVYGPYSIHQLDAEIANLIEKNGDIEYDAYINYSSTLSNYVQAELDDLNLQEYLNNPETIESLQELELVDVKLHDSYNAYIERVDAISGRIG